MFGLVLAGPGVFLLVMGEYSESQKAMARAAGVPAAVSLNDFDRKTEVHAGNEVHVTGWINPAFNCELTQNRKRKGSTTTTVERMFVLFGPEDGLDTRQVRAIVMLTPGEVDGFFDG